MSETVYLGAEHYHGDRGGIPRCPHLLWIHGDMDEATREAAERDGYAACGRCF